MNDFFERINTEPADLVLTDYGTITDGSTECYISKFIKQCKKNNAKIKRFKYDEEKKQFLLSVYVHEEIGYTRLFKISLSNEHKRLLEYGIIDDDIQALMNLANEKQLAIRKKEINQAVLATGEIPSNIEEIKLYAEYLLEQQALNKAQITQSCRKITSPIISAMVTVSSIMYAAKIDEGGGNVALGIPLGLLGGAGIWATGATIWAYYMDDYYGKNEFYRLKKHLQEGKMIYYKLLQLKLKCEQLGLLEKGQSIAKLPSGEDDDNYNTNSFSGSPIKI